jgi:magnesium chelatase family protein
MLASLRTAAVFGVESCPVHVEVDVGFGFPSFTMVGLPDASVRESRDRVRSAIRNSGFEFPPHRITVNLAPADVRKAGASFDLPIALGILAASGVVERRLIADLVLLGELSLDGSIHATRGVLPIAVAARRDGLSGMLLPAGNADEAAIVAGLEIVAVSSLGEAVHALNDPAGFRANSLTLPSAYPARPAYPAPSSASRPLPPDFADVRGQLLARRALEVAAAGGHNLLLVGPPGAGKTMMARRVSGILPPLSFDEALELTAIHSVAGLLPTLKEVIERIFTTGLIKLLFATETFAVGVNMPARTVVFNSIFKFDGKRLGPIKTREHHQMSGRAGRRGIDEVGYVYSVVEWPQMRVTDIERVIEAAAECAFDAAAEGLTRAMNRWNRFGRDTTEERGDDETV